MCAQGGGEEEGIAEEAEEEDPNQWYRWRQWSVTCYIRPPSKASGRPTSSSASSFAGLDGLGGGEAAGMRETQQLHLNVETCAVRPDLVLRTELPEVSCGRGSRMLVMALVKSSALRLPGPVPPPLSL